jgi:alkylation response protein AidB-like acyl-CoA dehydrogenase
VGVAAVASGIARAMLSEFMQLACRKTPRGMSRLADSALVQADVARAEARLGSARAYLMETLGSIYAEADEVAPIEVSDRARVRLACTNAIHGAIEVADFTYKAAGVDAIFPGSPFERRFRDMHTVTAQGQAHMSNFESAGQALFGLEPSQRL